MHLSKKLIITSILTLPIVFAPQLLFAKQISVPFTSQAPTGNWNQPWQDYCEEATIVMLNSFYINKNLNTQEAIKDLTQINNIKERTFGFSLDENAEKITEIINNFLPFEANIISNPTIQQIKNEIDNNRPVLIPAYGKALNNPRFQNGGPDYHTLVISGYDENSQMFTTQEPGTKYGKNYKYSYNTIMNAMHDLKKNNTKNGKKVAIFTQKNLTFSANIDADKDGLTKQQEFDNKTITWLSDSDGDGYSDGIEVANGYSPTRAAYKPKNLDLVKSKDSNKVYIIKNNNKHHISSEQVFIKNNYKWRDIKVIMSVEISMIAEGPEILK